MSVVLNGHTYSLAVLSGTDGRDYARPEPFTASGATLWDMFFTDLVAHLVSATSIDGISPGALYGFLRSTGSAWARVSGITPSTDLNAAVGYAKGGTGLTALGSALQVLRTNAGANAVEWGTPAGTKYALLNGNTADTLTANTWVKRTITTEVYDPDGIVSIASSQFTLQAGTYLVQAHAANSANASGSQSIFQLRLRNTTDSTTDGSGISEQSVYPTGLAASGFVTSMMAVISPAGEKIYEIDHYSGNAAGVGGHSNAGGETMHYVHILILKIA